MIELVIGMQVGSVEKIEKALGLTNDILRVGC